MEKTIRWMFLAAISVLLVYSLWSLRSVRSKLREAGTALAELQQEAASLARENESLRQGLDPAGSEDALRQIARDQLGLVLPGDRIYIIEDEN